MKKTFLLLSLAGLLMFIVHTPVNSKQRDQGSGSNKVEEEIWANEEAYFTCLYQANYEGVLALVHRQFLGWPGGLNQPIGFDKSAKFMKQLMPQPTSCRIRIERAGIRVEGNTALTQYTLHVDCSDMPGGKLIKPSRITHTWVKEGGLWKLLGGMNYDP